MLESMRNHAQSWIAKAILGGIILSFALWGVGDYFFGDRLETVATVDGDPVSAAEFYQAYQRQLNNYRAMMGGKFSAELARQLGVKDKTLQTIINRRVILAEAERMGLVAPEAALLNRIRSNPSFQQAGRFDPERYRILTRNMGFAAPADYEDEMRLNLLADALQKNITSTAVVTDAEVRDRFREEYEERVVEALIIRPEQFQSEVEVSEEEARQYYESHQDRYHSPLRVRLHAVEIDPDRLAAEMVLDETEIAEAYEERREEFTTPERRKARHILIRADRDADAATRKAARERAETALARVREGEPFAEVARELSEDATASDGGMLGYFSRGTMVPAFEEAAFSLEPGEVSGVVASRFGFHVIKVLDVQPAESRPLAEVRDELVARLKSERSRDEAYALSQDLDDAIGMEGNLKAAAERVNLPLKVIGPVSRDEALANDLLSGDPELKKRAFSLLPGQPVEIMTLADGRIVALETVERIEPKLLPFEEVVGRAFEAARQEKARQAARARAEEILAAAGSASFDALAQRFGVPKYISRPVRSSGLGDEANWLTTAVVDAAFRTAEGAVHDTPIDTSRGFTLLRVSRVEAPDEEKLAEQADSIREELRRQKGSVRFARWISSVRDRHEIEINAAALEKI